MRFESFNSYSVPICKILSGKLEIIKTTHAISTSHFQINIATTNYVTSINQIHEARSSLSRIGNQLFGISDFPEYTFTAMSLFL